MYCIIVLFDWEKLNFFYLTQSFLEKVIFLISVPQKKTDILQTE